MPTFVLESIMIWCKSSRIKWWKHPFLFSHIGSRRYCLSDALAAMQATLYENIFINFESKSWQLLTKVLYKSHTAGGHSLKVIKAPYFPNFKVTVQYGAGFKIKRHIIELLFKCINDATGGHLYPIKYQWKTIINSYFFREKKRWGDYIQIKTSLNIH